MVIFYFKVCLNAKMAAYSTKDSHWKYLSEKSYGAIYRGVSTGHRYLQHDTVCSRYTLSRLYNNIWIYLPALTEIACGIRAGTLGRHSSLALLACEIFRRDGLGYYVLSFCKIGEIYHFSFSFLYPIFKPELEIVDSLEETERGDGGFGSTGR